MTETMKLLVRPGKVPEETSQLLKLPVELRLLIYQYLLPEEVHIWVGSGHLRFSKCAIQRSDCGQRDVHVGRERAPDWLNDRDPVWIRRLQSPWGLHWACEEGVMRQDAEVLVVDTLIRVCKSMLIDILDILPRTAMIHITDLETITLATTSLSKKPISKKLWSRNPRTQSVQASFFEKIAKLSLTLRLPYRFCFVTTPYESMKSNHGSYFRLGSFLAQLKRLGVFRLLLDHDSHNAWARANEMHLLGPFTKLLEMKDVDSLVLLPKLSPRWENPRNHFMEGNAATFPLVRYVRQRFHALPMSSDYHTVKFKPDFPFLLGFPEARLGYLESAERELMKIHGHGTIQNIVENEYVRMVERKRKRRIEVDRKRSTAMSRKRRNAFSHIHAKL